MKLLTRDEIIDQIREVMEIKLAGILLSSDVNLKLIETREDKFVSFSYMLTTIFQRYAAIEVIIYGKEQLQYKLITNIKERKSYIFNDHEGLIKYIEENIS